jgi:hypothetical protein
MHRIEVLILKGCPGSGKTRKVFEDFKKFKGRCLYLGGSHKTLNEREKYLEGESYRHIYGLAARRNKGCPCLDKDENKEAKSPLIERLVDHRFSNEIVCSTCKKKKIREKLGIKECRYSKQFKGIKKCHVVLAPIQCIYSPNLLKKYQPQFIVIDDCLDAINHHYFDVDLWNQINYLAGIWENYHPFATPINLVNKKDENPLEVFSNRSDLDVVFPKLEEAFGRQFRKLVKQVKNSDSSTYDKTFLIPMEFVKDYLEHAKRYGFKRRVSRPAMYYMFDYAVEQMKKNRKVRMMLADAEPPYKILEILKERYRIETGVVVDFKNDDSFKPEIVNRGSVVYKIGNPLQWYPWVSLKQEHVQKSIQLMFELLMDYFFDDDLSREVGVITLKPRMPKDITETEKLKRLNERVRCFVPEQYKVKQPPATYWNLKSQNGLEYCDVLACIGSPVTNKSDMKLIFSDWFPHIKVDEKDFDVKEKNPHGWWYTYPNPYIEMLRYRNEEYETYQALHRNRPTRHQTIGWAWCAVPKEKLERDGIEVRYILNKKQFAKMRKRSQWLVDYVRAHGGKVFRGDAEEMLHDKFGVSRNYTYRAVLKIVRKSEHLKYENSWLIYEP